MSSATLCRFGRSRSGHARSCAMPLWAKPAAVPTTGGRGRQGSAMTNSVDVRRDRTLVLVMATRHAAACIAEARGLMKPSVLAAVFFVALARPGAAQTGQPAAVDGSPVATVVAIIRLDKGSTWAPLFDVHSHGADEALLHQRLQRRLGQCHEPQRRRAGARRRSRHRRPGGALDRPSSA